MKYGHPALALIGRLERMWSDTNQVANDRATIIVEHLVRQKLIKGDVYNELPPGSTVNYQDSFRVDRPSAVWIAIEDFAGEPNGSPLAWWHNARAREGEERPQLDEILLGPDGRCVGKGGCGADHYTHVMLAGFDRPEPPER